MYVRVEVKPGAKRETVIQTDEKTFSIGVKEPAERGLANKRVKEVLASFLEVAPGKIRMISGHRSPRKIFTID